jgi:hypothetical protein
LTHLSDSESRLDHITVAAQKLSGEQRKFVTARVKTLRNWEKNGRRMLPFMLKILGGDR